MPWPELATEDALADEFVVEDPHSESFGEAVEELAHPQECGR
ncbi:hypothetical protein [Streptomyces sp. ISL-86]|nr:hypothetical protein [Streptomyces sp. ISL-86]